MSSVNVLVIGSGGREHALAWALDRSPKVKTVFTVPGNGGTEEVGPIPDVDPNDGEALSAFAKENNVDLIVIGPEAPLVAGLSDDLRKRGHDVVGASQAAAQLEGSKIFAKKFMQKYGIPTADFKAFTDPEKAKAFASSPEGKKFRILKADGLAAGKGVFVNKNLDETLKAIDEVMTQKKFGDAGSQIILEETLEGPEVSVIALTDGKTLLPFPASQDHKRALDGDQGPNTGGMGAYAPTPFYDEATRTQVIKKVIDNFARGIQSEKLDFRGLIYFGLMLTADGPKVLEFNVRFGDPEAQAVLPLIDSDLYQAFKAVAQGKLTGETLTKKDAYACTVVMAAGGYPGSYQKGREIIGLSDAIRPDKSVVFQAGTKREDGKIITTGGRVLNVTGLGSSLEQAVVRAYQSVKKIHFDECQYRRDIAAKALKNKRLLSRIKKMRARKGSS